jgi:hypothetical protein
MNRLVVDSDGGSESVAILSRLVRAHVRFCLWTIFNNMEVDQSSGEQHIYEEHEDPLLNAIERGRILLLEARAILTPEVTWN